MFCNQYRMTGLLIGEDSPFFNAQSLPEISHKRCKLGREAESRRIIDARRIHSTQLLELHDSGTLRAEERSMRQSLVVDLTAGPAQDVVTYTHKCGRGVLEMVDQRHLAIAGDATSAISLLS